MKSILTNESCEKKEKPFPKLMINKNNGVVILFTDRTTGIVVNVAGCGDEYFIGEQSDGWTPIYYKDYEGSVCLSND